jgi:hypothetical protein
MIRAGWAGLFTKGGGGIINFRKAGSAAGEFCCHCRWMSGGPHWHLARFVVELIKNSPAGADRQLPRFGFGVVPSDQPDHDMIATPSVCYVVPSRRPSVDTQIRACGYANTRARVPLRRRCPSFVTKGLRALQSLPRSRWPVERRKHRIAVLAYGWRGLSKLEGLQKALALRDPPRSGVSRGKTIRMRSGAAGVPASYAFLVSEVPISGCSSDYRASLGAVFALAWPARCACRRR